MLPLSKAKLKTFISLQAKKNRQKLGLFIIEGKKMLKEALASSWEIHAVLFDNSQLEDNAALLQAVSSLDIFSCETTVFQKISSLQTPEGVLAVLRLPTSSHPLEQIPTGHGLLLDGIQDPGNLGTLIRTADWFGITQIICRKGTGDAFNPNVLRSSMGPVFRVQLYYVEDWQALIQSSAQRIWLADMSGIPVQAAQFTADSWLLLGNEANGVSPALQAISGIQKVHIPCSGGAESLNVAIAGGILMSALTL